MSDVTKIAMGIVGIALVATLVVNGTNTAKVASGIGGAFSNSISAAEKG